MKRLLAALIASATVLTGAANAGVITVTGDSADPSIPDLAVGSATLSIVGIFTNDEAVNFSQSFLAGPIASGASLDFGIIDADGTPAGFDNLVVSILSSAGVYSFQVTQDVLSGPASQILFEAFAALSPSELFTVAITGFAYNPGASTSVFSINFSAVAAPEVPLPAAAPLLLSGLAGLGFAFRKTRVAA